MKTWNLEENEHCIRFSILLLSKIQDSSLIGERKKKKSKQISWHWSGSIPHLAVQACWWIFTMYHFDFYPTRNWVKVMIRLIPRDEHMYANISSNPYAWGSHQAYFRNLRNKPLQSLQLVKHRVNLEAGNLDGEGGDGVCHSLEHKILGPEFLYQCTQNSVTHQHTSQTQSNLKRKHFAQGWGLWVRHRKRTESTWGYPSDWSWIWARSWLAVVNIKIGHKSPQIFHSEDWKLTSWWWLNFEVIHVFQIQILMKNRITDFFLWIESSFLHCLHGVL